MHAKSSKFSNTVAAQHFKTSKTLKKFLIILTREQIYGR